MVGREASPTNANTLSLGSDAQDPWNRRSSVNRLRDSALDRPKWYIWIAADRFPQGSFLVHAAKDLPNVSAWKKARTQAKVCTPHELVP